MECGDLWRVKICGVWSDLMEICECKDLCRSEGVWRSVECGDLWRSVKICGVWRSVESEDLWSVEI